MSSVIQRARWRRLWNLLGLVLAGMWVLHIAYGMRDKNEVREITAKMKTVCVGRFLIDMPGNAQISLRRAVIDGFNISNYTNETEQEFIARIAAREAEIKSTPNMFGGKTWRRLLISNAMALSARFLFLEEIVHRVSMGVNRFSMKASSLTV